MSIASNTPLYLDMTCRAYARIGVDEVLRCDFQEFVDDQVFSRALIADALPTTKSH